MAIEQYFQHSMTQDSFNKEKATSLAKWKSLSEESEDNSTNGFDCNICLDIVNDPVVTLCGHLYCWPCIYKWIHYQTASSEPPQCPVCKSQISQETLVPLYGRGQTTKPSNENVLDVGMFIPKRPLSPRCGVHTSPASSPSARPPPQLHRRSYAPPQLSSDFYTTTTTMPMPLTMSSTFLSPTTQMLGEMVYSRMFGNSETLYTYPNSYNLAGMSTARSRRQVMEADKSLSRLCFFFFCCFVLCLLLF